MKKPWANIILSLTLLVSGVQPAYSQQTPPISTSGVPSIIDSGVLSTESVNSHEFHREFRPLAGTQTRVVYSVETYQDVAADLENLDDLVRRSMSEDSAREAVQRLSSAIDLYTAILLDEKIPGRQKIEYTSTLEGGIYQAFVSLLRHYGADPINPKTRLIPRRSLVRKVLQEMVVDVKSFTSFPRDYSGQKIYSPFEKLYRDQATQHVIAKLQSLAATAHTTNDGDNGMIAENSRDMMKEIAIDNAIKTVNDRRAAQWIATGTYGFLAVASFFVIVDYVGIVDGLLGGAGRTEVSQLVTGIINFSVLSSIAALKAASIRGHVRAMVLNLEQILKDPKNYENRTPLRRSLATWLFRKSVDFNQKIDVLNELTPAALGGGGKVRCSAVHHL